MAQSAWVSVTDTEPPYLFVMLQGMYCGSGGCPIYGFRELNGAWQEIYFKFGGEGIDLLDTSTGAHRDIQQYEQMGAGQIVEHHSRWDGLAYRETTK